MEVGSRANFLFNLKNWESDWKGGILGGLMV